MNSATTLKLINLLSSLSPQSQQHQQLMDPIQTVQYVSQSVSRNAYSIINCSTIKHIPTATNQSQSSPNRNNNQSPQNVFKILTDFIPRPNNSQSGASSYSYQDPSDSTCCVKHCHSLKRIVKLGIFYIKYGQPSAASIAQYMCRSSEYNDLNKDYQHSVQYHLGNADKHQIIEMSREYGSIYDFLSNFKRNPQYMDRNQELEFYNKNMDIIYNGITPLNPAPPSAYHHLNPNAEVQNAIYSPIFTHHISSSIPCVLHNNPYTNARYTSPVQIFPDPPSSYPYNNTHIAPPSSAHNYNASQMIKAENLPFSINYNESNSMVPLPSLQSTAQHSDPKTFKFVSKFTNINASINHIAKRKAIPTRKYKCNLCDKEYKHLCNLKSHQKIHTDQALVCQHCNKRFGRKANYKEHLRIHTGETPYQCSFCQKRFRHHHSWKDHMRIHTGVTPYQCQYCHRKFKVGHNLTVHLRIHTGEKPYQCKICNKSFRQKSAINSHLKRMHRHLM